MSQKLSSPGVDTPEVDQSFIETGTPAPGAIFVGRTPEGPAFYPMSVANMDEFTATFGDLDPTMQLTYAAKNYLKNSTSLTVVRVLGSSDGTAATNGYTVGTVFGIADTSGTNSVTGSILAVIHASPVFAAIQVSGVLGDSNRFTVRFGTTFAATASFLTSSDDYIGKVLNTNPALYSTYGHYVNQLFPYRKPAASGSWYPVQQSPSPRTTFLRDYDHGRTSWIKSQLLGGQEYDLLRFHTRGDGRAANDQIKVTLANIKPSVAPSSYAYGTFDVLVRDFYDSDTRMIVLERYAACNLDPTSDNYVLRKIGDIQESFSTSTRKFVQTAGSFRNKSKRIIAEINTAANFPPQALPWGFRGFPVEIFSGSNVGNTGLMQVPALAYTPNQVSTNGNYDDNICWGVSFVSGGVADRMRAFPDGALTQANTTGSDADFSLKALSGTYVNGTQRYSYLSTYTSYSPIYSSASLQAFTLPFFGGFDGFDLRTNDPLYLQNTDIDSNIGVVSLKRAVDVISNPDQVVGNLLAIPAIHNLTVTDYARAMVNERKDMFYVMDVTGSTRPEVIANLNGREIDDNYTAAYYPDVIMDDQKTKRMVRLAPSVAVVGALAYNDRVAQAFFAPAGLNRGGLGQFRIVDIVDRLDHDDRDALYDNRLNPITKFPNEGIVIFGQKTLQLKASSLDRVNVRRLLILAKRAVANEANRLVFEPNNPSTWTRFVNKVNPILDGYRRDQGINRFKVVMDSGTNTSDVVDRNEMKGKIFLEPVKAAEFISIDFIITASGVTFGS